MEGNPRRLEADDEAVKYLIALNQQLATDGIDLNDTLAVETLVSNVLDEIKTRCASLASDRRTNTIVEKLILMAGLEQLLEFCRRVIPYGLFLCKNRYSSHILQVYIQI